MNKWMIVMVISLLPLFINDAFAQQQVNVTSASPCWMNYTATGIEVLQNCEVDTDYLAAVTGPFEWVTGGLFSMIIVIILIFMTWIKYKTPFYPITIGLLMLPMSLALFPDEFASFAFLMVAVSIGSIVWYVMVQRTRG